MSDGHRMFQQDVMRWKCFAPHPFWEGSRGYALRHKGKIAAFGCVVPCRFLTGSGMVASCDVIDWAASKAVPGAGIMLYRHIQGVAGTMINVGGTDNARSVLPKMGFQVHGERQSYTRVLRPWRQFRMATQRDWKSPLRMARDYRELMRAAQAAGSALTVRGVKDFGGVAAEVFPDPSVTRQVVCARNAESLGYFLTCPAARVEAHLLERAGKAVGYFLLSRVGWQCRIADLWIRSADRREWAEAYAAATATARLDQDIPQITVAASLPLQAGAVQDAGYRPTQAEPVFVLDPAGRLDGRHDLALNFLENDGFYWTGDSLR